MNRKIAIDTGKHTTKVVAESKGNTSTRFSFTSAIKANVNMTQDPANHILEYEGIKYLVGSQAQTFVEIDNSKDTELHKICVLTALALACDNGDRADVHIGFPLDRFYNKEQKTTYKNNMLPLGKHTVTIDGMKKTFEITAAAVRPEGYGAVHHSPNMFNKKTVNVIDIGGLNVNACTYKDGILQEGNITTLQKGGIMLYTDSLAALKTIANERMLKALDSLSPERIEEEVILGYHESIEGSKEKLKEVRAQFVDDIYNELMKRKFDFLKKFFFIGGTSLILKEEILEKFGGDACIFGADNFTDIQFINAEGFYKAMKKHN